MFFRLVISKLINLFFIPKEEKKTKVVTEKMTFRIFIKSYIIYYFLSSLTILYLHGYKLESLLYILLAICLVTVIIYCLYKFLVMPKYYDSVEDSLPAVISAISMGLAAGGSLTESILKAKENTHPEIQNIFDSITLMLSIGKTYEEATIKSISKKTNKKLAMLLLTFSIYNKYGGDIVEVLEHMHTSIQNYLEAKSKVTILSATAKSLRRLTLYMIPLLFSYNIYSYGIDDYVGEPGWFYTKIVIFLYISSNIIFYFQSKVDVL